jgi:hypothetical protein
MYACTKEFRIPKRKTKFSAPKGISSLNEKVEKLLNGKR